MSGNYKLVLKTDADVTLWTVDEVRDMSSNQTLSGMTLSGTLTVTSTAVTWSGNPTHSGNHTWSGNQVFNGNVTIGDAAADSMTVTPNAVTWTNNPTHSGNHTWSGNQVFNANTTIGDAAADTSTVNATPTFNANPLGKILGSTYTPTVTAITNLTSATANGTGKYGRIGNLVFGMVAVTVDETTGSTATEAAISVPIASNFTANTDLLGGGVNTTEDNILVSADTSNDRISLTWVSPAVTPSHKATIWFCYEIL
jgi:hypothetical protein